MGYKYDIRNLAETCAKFYGDRIAYTFYKNDVLVEKSYNQLYKDMLNYDIFYRESQDSKAIVIISENSYEYVLLVLAAYYHGIPVFTPDPHSTQDALKEYFKKIEVGTIYVSREMYYYPGREEIMSGDNVQIIEDLKHFDMPKNYLDRWKKNVTRHTPAHYLLSSGTTSSQKIIELTYDNISSAILVEEKRNEFGPIKVCSMIPMYYCFGIITDNFYRLFCGATLHISKDVQAFFQAVPVIKPDYVTIAASIMKYYDSVLKLDDNLKGAFVGGSAISKADEQRLINDNVFVSSGYGLSEACACVFANFPNTYKYGSVGIPISSTVETKIAEDGELLLKGPQISHRYIGSDLQLISNDGWLHTGDIFEVDEDGFFYFKGRSKSTIVLYSGLNIFPEEIESELNALPSIIDSFVTDYPKSSGNVKCIVFAKENATESILKIMNKFHIEDFTEADIVYYDKFLPKTSTNKTKRPEGQLLLEKLVK